ncbi:MAG: Ppx/GppA family phosphatase, partial [Candidatus Cloacimonadota bacterium]
TFSYIENFFAEHDLSGNPDVLFGIGGTVTSMGAVKHKMEKYNPEIIQGSTMELEEVERQIELYKSKTIEERKNITGLQPKRADVILAGAAIVKTIMKTFGKDSFIISDRGLRHGLMYDKYIAR